MKLKLYYILKGLLLNTILSIINNRLLDLLLFGSVAGSVVELGIVYYNGIETDAK